MKWIALDIGTQNTGYAVYIEKNKKPKLLSHGYFSIKGHYAKDRFPEMLCKITDLIYKEQPDFITVEGFYSGKNFKSVEYLAKLQGWVEGQCSLGGYKFITIAAQSWRKGCGMTTGRKRNNEKQSERIDYKKMAREFAIKIARIEDMTEDECDAICIGYGAYEKLLLYIQNEDKIINNEKKVSRKRKVKK